MERGGSPRWRVPSAPALLCTFGEVADLSELLSPLVDLSVVISIVLKITQDNMCKGCDHRLF